MFISLLAIRGRIFKLKPVGVVTLPRFAGVEVPGDVVPLTSRPGGGGTFSDGVLDKNTSIFFAELSAGTPKTLEF